MTAIARRYVDAGGSAPFYTRVLAQSVPPTVEPLLRATPDWVSEAIAGLSSGVSKSVLDLGYGAGRIAIELAERGFDVVAVDQIPGELFARRWKHHSKRRSVRTVQAALEEYSDSASYGVVLALDVLHYLPVDTIRRLLVSLCAAAPSGALHLLQVFVDVERSEDGRTVRLKGEAGLTQDEFAVIIDDLYRGWIAVLRPAPYEERATDGAYRFSATRVQLVAVRP